MKEKENDKLFDNLPACAAEFIKLVIRKMRYRKKVRADVMAELTAHFEDELKDCATKEEKEQKAQKLIEDFGDVKLLAVLLRRAKKRCRPLWRTVAVRTFQTVGILIVFFIVYVVWFLTGKPVVTVDYVAELNRIVRPTADESLNAAPLYEKAVERYNEKSSDEMDELLGTKYNEATDEQKKLIAKWLEDNKEIFDLLIAAMQKPYYWPKYEEGDEGQEMVGVLMPHLAEFRKLAYALRWRIWLTAEQGRYKEAFDNIKTCYRLGQHIKKGDKFLIDQLVGIAVESIAVQTLRSILSESEIDSSKLATLQKDFEKLISGEDFVISLKAEKLLVYDEIQRCFTEDHLGGGHLYIPRITALGNSVEQEDIIYHDIMKLLVSPEDWPRAVKGGFQLLFLHPNKKQTRKAADRYYALAENIMCKSPAQIRAEGIDVEKETMETIKDNLLLGVLAPAIDKVNQISYRNKADVEATLTIIAVLRYKKDFGSYPDNLDKLLTAGYLKDLPMDLYSDKPLIYKRTDNDFTLYSVSLNSIDDGGDVARLESGGVRIWADEADAVFWPVYK